MHEKAESRRGVHTNSRAILDSHWDQHETIYVSKHQYLWLTLLLNAYCDFCAVAHSKFKVRWIYLSNTCWRKINFYDKWCDACLALGRCRQPRQNTAYPLLKGCSSLSEHQKVLVTLECLGLSYSTQEETISNNSTIISAVALNRAASPLGCVAALHKNAISWHFYFSQKHWIVVEMWKWNLQSQTCLSEKSLRMFLCLLSVGNLYFYLRN